MRTWKVGNLLITGGIVMACIAIQSSEPLRSAMIYDRAAIFSGEFLRLLTGHLVHFSWSHLVWNCFVLMTAGLIFAHRGYAGYLSLCITSSFIIGLYFLLFKQTLIQYSGLSGIVTALLAYLSFKEMGRYRHNRWLWVSVLLLMGAKIIFELIRSESLFVSLTDYSVRVVPEAHLMGLVIGTWYYFQFSLTDSIDGYKTAIGADTSLRRHWKIE